jgi:cytidylate kinase
MTIITISRGSYSKGKEVAEKVADRLGYECLSREVILDASDHYHIPEIKLIKAIHDAPSILERFGHNKSRFMAYYQSVLSRRVQKDNVVYHGLAGHLLLKDIPHVLNVRIYADLMDRVDNEMEREKIPRREAERLILKDDEERRKWTQSLYGVDPWNSFLYDMILRIHKFAVNDAVEFICNAATMEQLKTTPESQQKIDDLVLASQIKADLIESQSDIAVTSDYGNVVIYTKADKWAARKLKDMAKNLTDKNKDIRSLEVQHKRPIPSNAV